ncbi:MAG: hypothetical protein K9L74_02925 [Candidatus Izimaplasma sp.]|nr:hypothetical protein [Candidatus Izimaplasma bacterium]
MENKKIDFIRNVISFIMHPVNSILYIGILVIMVVLWFTNTLIINAGNYTWIYSTSMQVLAAMIALLPISYSFYLARVDEEQDSILDRFIIRNLKKDGYYDLMFVILFSILTIIMNLIFLFLLEKVIFAIVATLFTLLSIQYAAVFVYRLFNPDRVKEHIKKLDTSTRKTKEDSKITLDGFIKQYLSLEAVVKDYISNENDNEIIDDSPLYDIVDQFQKDIPAIKEHYDIFKEIIYHRNNIIHNYTEISIDKNKYSKILELIEEFKKLNNKFISDNIFKNVTSIRTIIDKAVKDYSADYRNVDVDIDSASSTNYEEVISNIFEDYFVSPYYKTLNTDECEDTDFEVVQNNYSERKILGIELRMTDSKNFKDQYNELFDRLKDKYLYLFVVNNNIVDNIFEIGYMTKDKKVKSYKVSY